MKGINHDHKKRSAVSISDTVNRIMKDLKANANADYKANEEKLGINTSKAYGVPLPVLKSIARRTGIDPRVADELWKTGVHEARILASMVYDPDSITESKIDSLIKDVDSWDLCDNCCGELFSKTVYADKKISDWTARDEEYVKRAGFVMIAYKALRDPDASNSDFRRLFKSIINASSDERNYVKKAVSWALREIGKRNITLNGDIIELAYELQKSDSQAAQWIAKSVISELKSERVQNRLKARVGHM
ncbi:MAG: DNA alkylation repair protein [Candidatus Micrarchaeia archaeon]